MANRFSSEKHIFRPSENFFKVLSVIVFFVIALVFIKAIDYTGKSSIEKQQTSLESAIARDIVQCYAIEGTYPPSLEYMEQHYGLTYDKTTFFVDYQPVASNLYPDYTVILR